MHSIDICRLLLLGAIWGGSFPFMRVLVPALGPMATADLRMLIAGASLVLYSRIIGFDIELKRFWKTYMIIGLVNSGLPFVLYSFAALHIPASYSVIFNATSPLFGAIFSVIWLGEALTFAKMVGLLLGLLGVALVSKAGPIDISPAFWRAVAACLGGAACYALAVIYIKRHAHLIKPMAVAAGGQLLMGVAMLPFLALAPPSGPFTPSVALNLLGLALLCSALAYTIYYRLIMNVGPTRALMVTYLMPAFGMVWGALFLDEAITWTMIAGCTLIVLGTALVIKTSTH
ncbi:MAG TPA: DMT family transporter [Syntrophorhabdales bacterium]|nr:DMT family transporter [Syntrophorhabdales bacterium]